MAITEADLVYETSTTTGTGTLNLDGAASSEFRTFVAGIGTGNKCRYKIRNRAAAEWEIGIGTVTDASPDTLSRTTVTASSNAGALVDFSAGTKEVECVRSANATPIYDESGNVGIGTTTPGFKLDIISSTGSGGLRVRNTQANLPTMLLGITDVANVDWSFQNNSGDLRFIDGNSVNAVTFKSGGNVGIGTTAPATIFDVNGDSVRVRTSQTPASNGTGVQGEISWDADYVYVCTATNTWKRAALTGGY